MRPLPSSQAEEDHETLIGLGGTVIRKFGRAGHSQHRERRSPIFCSKGAERAHWTPIDEDARNGGDPPKGRLR